MSARKRRPSASRSFKRCVRHALSHHTSRDVLLGVSSVQPASRISRARWYLRTARGEPASALAVEQVDPASDVCSFATVEPHFAHLNTGMGTPTNAGARCTSQDGRPPWIRYGSKPTRGIHSTSFSMALSAFSRRLFLSMDTNHWSVARKMTGSVAPAVRVAVQDLLLGHQRAAFAQPFDDDQVRFVNVEARERARLVGENAVVVHRHEQRHVELQRHEVVVLTMAGSRVHRARAGVQRDVVAVDDGPLRVLADGARVGEAGEFAAP